LASAGTVTEYSATCGFAVAETTPGASAVKGREDVPGPTEDQVVTVTWSEVGLEIKLAGTLVSSFVRLTNVAGRVALPALTIVQGSKPVPIITTGVSPDPAKTAGGEMEAMRGRGITVTVALASWAEFWLLVAFTVARAGEGGLVGAV